MSRLNSSNSREMTVKLRVLRKGYKIRKGGEVVYVGSPKTKTILKHRRQADKLLKGSLKRLRKARRR